VIPVGHPNEEMKTAVFRERPTTELAVGSLDCSPVLSTRMPLSHYTVIRTVLTLETRSSLCSSSSGQS
jgi:hypothetical protein